MNIFVAGHKGMVGRSIVRALKARPDISILTAEKDSVNLLDQQAVMNYFSKNKIDQVYLAAAKVGGINSNISYPGQFLYENLAIQSNVIHGAHSCDVNKLMFFGSSCIYPVNSPQPICEDSLLKGPLEPTNEPYAIAKISGIKLCESYRNQYGRDYRCIMPTNLYGPFDNFDLANCHVIPALFERFHNAVKRGSDVVVLWGSGTPLREFLYVDDLAAAAIHLHNIEPNIYRQRLPSSVFHVNVGTGRECTISEVANKIAAITGFMGKIQFDSKMPDGAPRKLLDVSLAKSLGWEHQTGLSDGLNRTYAWYLQNCSKDIVPSAQ